MRSELRMRSAPARHAPASGGMRGAPGSDAGASSDAGVRMKPEARAGAEAARQRDLACLAHAIDTEVIPQLAMRHRSTQPVAGKTPDAKRQPQPADVAALLGHLLAGQTASIDALIARLRQEGCTVESVYLDLLKPAAQRLGDLWCDDEIDFANVTLACGRLQRVMRELSPEFAAEAEAAPHAHRALFVQAEGEQHGFGLSMLAEFFRRAGWDVLGGIGTAASDPLDRVRREWVDLVGLSVGSEPRLAWTREMVERVRAASLNRHLVVMVGGPLFDQHPELLGEVNADATATNARDALRLADALVASRQAAAGNRGT